MVTDSDYRVLRNIVVSKETIKTEDSSLRVENTTEGLRANISCIESNKLEQATETENLIDNIWEQGNIGADLGEISDNSKIIRTKNFQKVYPNHLYKISRNIADNAMSFRFYDKDLQYVGNPATDGLIETNISNNQMGTYVTEMEMTIKNSTISYMKIVDASNDLSTVYTMTTEAINTDYPSLVEGLTGDVNLKVRNNNYFDISKWKDVRLGGTGANEATIAVSDKIIQIINNGGQDVFTKTATITNSLNEATQKYLMKIDNQKDIVVKFDVTGTSGTADTNSCCYTLYDKNFSTIKYDMFPNFSIPSSNKIIIKPTSDTAYIGVRFGCKRVANSTIIYSNIQVTQDTTSNQFVDHKEKNFTISLGNKILYKGDKIVRKNGKWYFSNKFKTRDFSKKPLVSSEVSYMVEQGYYFKPTDIKYVSGNRAIIFSNMQKVGDYSSTDWKKFDGNLIGQLYPEVQKGIYVNYKPATQKEFVDWWNSLGVKLVYELAEEELEPIEGETLIKQLNAIYLYIREYEDVTNFDFDNDVTFEINIEKNNLKIMDKRLDEYEKQNITTSALALESEDLI